MPNAENLVSLAQYAKAHNVDRTAVFRKIKSGRLQAVKIGSYWLIDKDEPYTDHRIKDGSYVGDRAKRRQRKALKEEQTTDDNI